MLKNLLNSKILRTLIFCFGLLQTISHAQPAEAAEKSYTFYSPDDYANVRKSVQTPWGKKIIESLKKNVEERRKHDLKVPAEKTGRYHGYFCPKHAVELTFNWATPESHYCKVCKEELKGYKGSWLYMANFENAEYLNDCMWLYMATGERKYADYIRDMFLDYAGVYKNLKEYSKEEVAKKYHIGRLFDQWLDESTWFTKVARAYDVAKKEMTQAERKTIENDLFRNAGNLLMNREGGNNWQVWNNSGRIMVGVVLKDDKIIEEALNGKKGYVKVLARELNPDGWYNEASPGYHFFPLHAFIHTANAARAVGINLFDENFYKTFGAVANGVYPDLSFVAHNDGWYGISILKNTDLYEFAYARYRDPFLREVLSQAYSRVERIAPEALLTGEKIEPAKKPFVQKSYIFENTGYALLRDGKNTVTLVWGQGEGGHGHPNKLAITIHNGKGEILPDMGTSGYGAPAYKKWYKKTLAHNTVSVDFKDHELRFPTGKPDKNGKRRTVKGSGELIKFEPSVTGGKVSAKAEKSVEGVVLTREVSLDNAKILDNFKCVSDSEHVYEYTLLFMDKPELSSKGVPAQLNESIAHEQIKNVLKYECGKKFLVKTKTASVEIENLAGDKMEVFVGEALGPVLVLDTESDSESIVYPLIIRTKARNLDLNAKWILK